eukprot:Phypoly_transcript_18083.p1 GENE.Phypoly_transcript_18083~~Phypoly_transcript_18083.p1  ORF type:complete len:236 (+),score=52.14 Phypoly_transcript_18083:35-709(+)
MATTQEGPKETRKILWPDNITLDKVAKVAAAIVGAEHVSDKMTQTILIKEAFRMIRGIELINEAPKSPKKSALPEDLAIKNDPNNNNNVNASERAPPRTDVVAGPSSGNVTTPTPTSGGDKGEMEGAASTGASNPVPAAQKAQRVARTIVQPGAAAVGLPKAGNEGNTAQAPGTSAGTNQRGRQSNKRGREEDNRSNSSSSSSSTRALSERRTRGRSYNSKYTQ